VVDVRANIASRLNAPFIALAGLALLGALWAALVRVGWNLPELPIPIAGQHGPLMISGFLGTLVSLERAVALKWRWTYGVPLLSGVGAISLLLDVPPIVGRGLIALGALGLTLVSLRMYRLRPAVYVATMGLGALLWLAGSVLWWAGWSTYRAVPWWAGFLILIIAGERLDLARVLMPGRASRSAFVLAVGLFCAGLLISLVSFELGLMVGGAGLAALGVWLLRNDIARRTIRKSGLTRFIAACLLPGYVWLIIGGGLWLAFGVQYTNGLIYDAMLHSLFLGFVFSMIFGHAPIIIPAVMNIDMDYRPVFYAHLGLLHISLIVRVAGDLVGSAPLRMWGGLFNVIAILIFLPIMARSMRRRPEAVPYSTP
jgi:hypothetical protein